MRRALFVCLCAIVGCCLSNRVYAYCFARTDAPRFGACVDSDAPRLHWERSCLTYVFHSDVFERLQPKLSEPQVRSIAQDSFTAWLEVDCEALGSFSIQQQANTTSGEALEFLRDVENESVLSAMTREEWDAAELDDNAIAMTHLWYSPSTGEIYDVDVLLNLGQGAFGSCDPPCTDGTIDLRNTLTHEAGHVLGLGHTPVYGATMAADARPGATFMRSLEVDDKLGLCALELPTFTCESESGHCFCDPPPIIPSVIRTGGVGCAVGAGGGSSSSAGSSTAWLMVACLGLSLWARRRHGGARGARAQHCDR